MDGPSAAFATYTTVDACQAACLELDLCTGVVMPAATPGACYRRTDIHPELCATSADFVLFTRHQRPPPPPVPLEWRAAIDRADMLYAVDESAVPAERMATIGNGYLAMTMGAPSFYVAGLYNGPAQAEMHVSHRAALPQPFHGLRGTVRAANGESVELSDVGSALDLRRARYLRRFGIVAPAGSTAPTPAIEQRWLAPRTHRQILLMQARRKRLRPFSLQSPPPNITPVGVLRGTLLSSFRFRQALTLPPMHRLVCGPPLAHAYCMQVSLSHPMCNCRTYAPEVSVDTAPPAPVLHYTSGPVAAWAR